jgi:exopolysaccharide biosynthesis polyprenyl glycosylphosphotransferase
MLRRFSINAAMATMLIDILLVMLGIKFASLLTGEFNLATYLVFPLVWWAFFLAGSLYDGRRNLQIVDELSAYTSIGLLIAMTLAGLVYLLPLDISRSQFVLFIALTALMQLIARALWRIFWQHSAKTGSSGIRKVLIIGAGEMGRRVNTEIQKYFNETAIKVIGFLDDDPIKLSLPEVLGKVEDAGRFIKEGRASDIVITLPASAHKLREKLVEILQALPVRVWIIPDTFRLALNQSKVENFAGMPMLDVRAPAINEHQRLAKRIFDLLLGTILLATLWPLMLLIALLIRRDSPGPAIFRQTRVGENSQLFEMYKFRTMVQDAESLRHLVEQHDENGNLSHKRPADPRITAIGYFLRSTSLDELPQLFNVLKGDMSLVGPRPELPYLVEKYYQPWQYARFSVPPGITGWWQVNGRSDKPMHLHTEDDLYYVQNCSIWLDIQIMLKTVLVVVLRKGAY